MKKKKKTYKKKLSQLPVDKIMEMINNGELDEDQFDELEELLEELKYRQ